MNTYTQKQAHESIHKLYKINIKWKEKQPYIHQTMSKEINKPNNNRVNKNT